jgi:hypothetical protein
MEVRDVYMVLVVGLKVRGHGEDLGIGGKITLS